MIAVALGGYGNKEMSAALEEELENLPLCRGIQRIKNDVKRYSRCDLICSLFVYCVLIYSYNVTDMKDSYRIKRFRTTGYRGFH